MENSYPAGYLAASSSFLAAAHRRDEAEAIAATPCPVRGRLRTLVAFAVVVGASLAPAAGFIAAVCR